MYEVFDGQNGVDLGELSIFAKSLPMKYPNLTISDVPKTFSLCYAADYIQPFSEDMDADDIQYDTYLMECDIEKGEDACALFKYNESATGVEIVHNSPLQALSLWLSPWAVEADVQLYATFVNAVLAKHKRARLYDKYAPLKSLTDENVQQMIKERKRYVKRLFTTKDVITMVGINDDYTIMGASLLPPIDPDIVLPNEQRAFVKKQWKSK